MPKHWAHVTVFSNLLAIVTSSWHPLVLSFSNTTNSLLPLKQMRKVWKHCWLPPPQPFPPLISSLLADHYFCPGVGLKGHMFVGPFLPTEKNGESKTWMAILLPFARSVLVPNMKSGAAQRRTIGRSIEAFQYRPASLTCPRLCRAVIFRAREAILEWWDLEPKDQANTLGSRKWKDRKSLGPWGIHQAKPAALPHRLFLWDEIISPPFFN